MSDIYCIFANESGLMTASVLVRSLEALKTSFMMGYGQTYNIEMSNQ